MDDEAVDWSWRWLLFSFKGRLSRRDYFRRGMPACSIGGLVAFAVGGAVFSRLRGDVVIDGGPSPGAVAATFFLGAVAVAMIWIMAALFVKRLHDRNWPSWLIILALAPVVSLWVALRRGTGGPNRYGMLPARSIDAPRWGAFWLDLVAYFIPLAFAVGFRTFALEPFNIPSGSNIPTLLVGDYLFVEKWSYGYSRFTIPFATFGGRIFAAMPERGDVVIFKLPRDPSVDYVKRVVGLPGDKVQMKAGRLYLNGEAVAREPAGSFVDTSAGVRVETPRFRETLPNGVGYDVLQLGEIGPIDNTDIYVVPPDHLFVLGDNRSNSLDSRILEARGGVGYVPLDHLVGRAAFRFFSISDGALPRFWTWPFRTRYARLLTEIR